jgi:UDP-2,4-diacetamido-2,4,6-trideoxy-beta-L-altropyranose hydrolase
METILIRADAAPNMGIGHAMRCLSLAEAWQDAGGKSIFVTSDLPPTLSARIVTENIDVVYISDKSGSANDAFHTVELAKSSNAGWVVVDGYQFGADYQDIVKETGLSLLFLDDNGHANHYTADIILNQNLHASESLYVNRELYSFLLLGPKYALLRREFLKPRRWKRQIPDVAKRVLVTVGGGNPENITATVIRALQRIDQPGLEAKVIIGPNNPNYYDLSTLTNQSDTPIELIRNANNLSELMMWADVAVSGGGTTCWELAYMALPSIILVLAVNQRVSLQTLVKRGCFIGLDSPEQFKETAIYQALKHILINKETRTRLSYNVSRLIDGHGVHRVMKYISSTAMAEVQHDYTS